MLTHRIVPDFCGGVPFIYLKPSYAIGSVSPPVVCHGGEYLKSLSNGAYVYEFYSSVVCLVGWRVRHLRGWLFGGSPPHFLETAGEMPRRCLDRSAGRKIVGVVLMVGAPIILRNERRVAY